jgi:HEPN domain-containing protein
MDKQEHIQFWIATAKHDLDAMRRIFESRNYDWALFIGHLALEKILKALWVKHNESNFPPKTHNLLKLAEDSSVSLSEIDATLLGRVNRFHLESRYPSYKLEFYKMCTPEYTLKNINEIEQFFQCMIKLL